MSLPSPVSFILAASGTHLGNVDIHGTFDAESISVALSINVLNAMVVQGDGYTPLDGYTPPVEADEVAVVLAEFTIRKYMASRHHRDPKIVQRVQTVSSHQRLRSPRCTVRQCRLPAKICWCSNPHFGAYYSSGRSGRTSGV